MGYGVFRRRPRHTPRQGLPWLGTSLDTSQNTLLDYAVAEWPGTSAEGNPEIDEIASYDLAENSTDTTGVGSTTGGLFGGNRRDHNGANNEYFNVAHADALSAAGGFAFGVWCELDAISGDLRIAGMGNSGLTTGSWRAYHTGSGTIKVSVTDGTGSVEATSLVTVSAAARFHLYVEYDIDNDLVGISVNGETLVQEDTSGLGTIAASTSEFRIFRTSGGSPHQNDGKWEQAALFSGPIGATNRAALYNGGSGLAVADWNASASGGAEFPFHIYYAGAF